jgi:uncharacterized protein (TIRG00374 family)
MRSLARQSRTRLAWLLIQVAVSVALIGVLLWRTDIAEAARVVSKGDYAWVAAAVPLLALAVLCWSYRSQLALKKLGPTSLPTLAEAYATAGMVNALLPMRMGDILRVQVLSRRYGFPSATVASTVFVTETLFDGMAFVVLFLWALALFGIPHILLNLAWMLAVALFMTLIAAVLASRLELGEGWEDRWWFRGLPALARKPLRRLVPQVVEGLSLFADVRLATRAFSASLCAWTSQAALYWVYGRVFGLDLSVDEAVTVMITAAIVTSVPLVPTSLGTYEAAITGVLVLLGVSNGQALAYAAGSHALNIALAVVGGLLCMWLLRLRPRDLILIGERHPGTVEEAEASPSTQRL